MALAIASFVAVGVCFVRDGSASGASVELHCVAIIIGLTNSVIGWSMALFTPTQGWKGARTYILILSGAVVMALPVGVRAS